MLISIHINAIFYLILKKNIEILSDQVFFVPSLFCELYLEARASRSGY